MNVAENNGPGSSYSSSVQACVRCKEGGEWYWSRLSGVHMWECGGEKKKVHRFPKSHFHNLLLLSLAFQVGLQSEEERGNRLSHLLFPQSGIGGGGDPKKKTLISFSFSHPGSTLNSLPWEEESESGRKRRRRRVTGRLSNGTLRHGRLSNGRLSNGRLRHQNWGKGRLNQRQHWDTKLNQVHFLNLLSSQVFELVLFIFKLCYFFTESDG